MEIVPNAILKAVVAPRGAKLFRKPKKAQVGYGYHGAYQQAADRRDHSNATAYGEWDEKAGKFLWRNRPDWNEDSASQKSWKSGAQYNKDYLLDWEFLFWFGSTERTSNWGTCRVCKCVKWNHEARVLHTAGECRKRLFQALKKLRLDNKCCVCNKGGGVSEKLGVYFCSEACQNRWKHGEHDLEAQRNFREALRLVGYVDTNFTV